MDLDTDININTDTQARTHGLKKIDRYRYTHTQTFFYTHFFFGRYRYTHTLRTDNTLSVRNRYLPKPETRNRKLNPEPETRNPKPRKFSVMNRYLNIQDTHAHTGTQSHAHATKNMTT
jgi:hypothetical protein